MKRIDELKDIRTVAIAGHIRPDGDFSYILLSILSQDRIRYLATSSII